jgi:uncharacterized protein (TIGR04141 family)
LTQYADEVVKHLQIMEPQARFGNRPEWTIVYAMGTEKPGRLADSMFFFSKLNLDRAARTIKHTFGLQVAIAKIPA